MTVLRPKPGPRPPPTAPSPEEFARQLDSKQFVGIMTPGWLDTHPNPRAELEAGAKAMRRDHNRTSWTRTCENIIERFRAGDTVQRLAFDYRLEPSEIEDVIRAALKLWRKS